MWEILAALSMPERVSTWVLGLKGVVCAMLCRLQTKIVLFTDIDTDLGIGPFIDLIENILS